jgi:hypothetical protein
MSNVGDALIVGTKWNKGMVVQRKGKNGSISMKRLRNWYLVNEYLRDNDTFTWGYIGTGPTCTAYSILYELFGEAVALERSQEFMERYVSKVPEDTEFMVTGGEICKMLNLRTARK